MINKDAIIKIAVFLLMAVTLWFFLKDWLSIEVLRANAAVLEASIRAHPLLAGLAFIFMYVLAVVFTLPGASLLTMAAGFLFPFVWALAMVVVSATIGATILFLLVQSSLGRAFKQKAEPVYNKIQAKFAQKPVSTLLFLRFLPVFPFFLVNIAVGLLNIRVWTAIWTCFVGILPGTALYVLLGRQLSAVDNPADLVGWEFFVLMSAMAFLSLLPRWLKGRDAGDEKQEV